MSGFTPWAFPPSAFVYLFFHFFDCQKKWSRPWPRAFGLSHRTLGMSGKFIGCCSAHLWPVREPPPPRRGLKESTNCLRTRVYLSPCCKWLACARRFTLTLFSSRPLLFCRIKAGYHVLFFADLAVFDTCVTVSHWATQRPPKPNSGQKPAVLFLIELPHLSAQNWPLSSRYGRPSIHGMFQHKAPFILITPRLVITLWACVCSFVQRLITSVVKGTE